MILFSGIKGGSTWILDSGAGNRLKEQKSPLSPAWLRCLVHTCHPPSRRSGPHSCLSKPALPKGSGPAIAGGLGGGGVVQDGGGSQAGVIRSTPASLGHVREKQSAAFRDRREKLSSAFSGPTLKTGRRRRRGKKEPPRKRDESRSSALMSRQERTRRKRILRPPARAGTAVGGSARTGAAETRARPRHGITPQKAQSCAPSLPCTVAPCTVEHPCCTSAKHPS